MSHGARPLSPIAHPADGHFPGQTPSTHPHDLDADRLFKSSFMLEGTHERLDERFFFIRTRERRNRREKRGREKDEDEDHAFCSIDTRKTSATLQACAMQPRGV